MPDAPKPLSIKEQAEYLGALVGRCHAHGIENVLPFAMYFNQEDVKVLEELVARLKRMAPHEPEIRRMVTGR